jgi:site-specific DNA recombinase
MKIAAAYVRVSTDAQADEQTYQTQIDEVKLRAKSDGNALSTELIYLDDGWSGAILERPSLDRLRQDARERKFEVLYVYDKGRLSRVFIHQEIIIDELRSFGIEFISLHDINGSSPEEKMMGGVMGIFHEYDRVKIAERFRLAKLSKVRHGGLLGYNPPYGYDYVPVRGKGSLKVNGQFTINEEEARVVRMLMDWVGNEGLSLRQARTRLYEHKIPPKKHKNIIWTTGPLRRLLANETYIGKHYYNKSESCLPRSPKPKTEDNRYKNRHTNKTSRKSRPREEWLLIEVPSIVDRKLFAKVQKRLLLNKKFSRRNNSKNDYLLTGLVYCDCGKTRTGEGVNGHTYYRCTDRLSRFPLPRTCTRGGVSVKILDTLTWNQIEALLSSRVLLKQQAEKWIKSNSSQSIESESKRIKDDLAQLLFEEKRYAKAYGEGIMSGSIYREQMESLIARRKTLLDRHKAATHEAAAKPPIDATTLAAVALKVLSELSFDEKKAIVRQLVTKINVTQEEVTIWGNIPITPESKVGLSAEHRPSRPA